MSQFVVSARKYRPSTFKSVVGQEALTTTLRNAILKDKLSHAYLFCGPRGVGKTSCARIFAKTINCQNRTPEGEACNECESCVAANSQRSYNVMELDAASNNSVNDIRSLIDQVHVAPSLGKYKVYIIDEVHMLSTAAFNAFLKTLEEPPAHAIFILATTEKHKVLPTIISRCQVHDFNRITSEDIAAHLQYIAGQEGIEADPEALFYIAMSADGGMRDALSMFDQIASFGNGKVTTEGVRENLNLLADDDYFALLAHILQGNHHKTLTLIDGLLARGYEGNNIIRGFSGFLRNVLLAQTPDTLPLVEVPARTKERMVKAGQYAPSNLLWEYLKISTATGSKYTSAAERRLALEMSLLQMCEKSPQSPLRTPPDPAPTPTQGTSTPPQPDRQPPQSNNTTRQTIASAPAPTTPQPEVTAPRSSNNAINKYGFNMLEGRSTADLVAEGAPTQQPPKPTEKRNTPIEKEAFKKSWFQYTNSIKDMFVRSILKSRKPTLAADGHTLQVSVASETERLQLQDITPHLLSYLANELNNDYLALQVEVVQDSHVLGPRTPQEKYNHFAKKNEWFVKFTQDLQLRPIS